MLNFFVKYFLESKFHAQNVAQVLKTAEKKTGQKTRTIKEINNKNINAIK